MMYLWAVKNMAGNIEVSVKSENLEDNNLKIQVL